MSKILKKLKEEKSGEIMIESCIIILITVFLLTAILSLGFAYYQQSMLKTVAVETAEMIGANYKYTSQDDIDNVILNEDTIKDISMYRTTFQFEDMAVRNEKRAKDYVLKRISITNLGINESDPKVESLEVKIDDIGRIHVDIEISMETQILFQGALEYFGVFNETPKYTATAHAECLDISGYTNLVRFGKYVDEGFKETALGKIISNVETISENVKKISDTLGFFKN